MPLSVLNTSKINIFYDKLRWLYRQASWLADDFWQDGRENSLNSIKLVFKNFKPSSPSVNSARPLAQPPATFKTRSPLWHAAPSEIAEQMWGTGQILPCDKKISEEMIKPLTLNKDTSVIDITAGFGERLIKISKDFGADVVGMDCDTAIVTTATERLKPYINQKFSGVATYDIQQFSTEKKYDALLARELFYRVPKAIGFFKTLSHSAQPLAQFSFTDYIVEPEDRDVPQIRSWMLSEKGVSPFGLVDLAEAWAKAGVSLRVYDNQTDLYKTEIIKGIKRLSIFLTSVKPDPLTKKLLLETIDIWAQRLAAFEHGMKFYRIYGIKD